MRASILFTVVTTTLLTTACLNEPKKHEFYHYESGDGICAEWVWDTVDPTERPKELGLGPCPQEIKIGTSDKAYRYASCPDIRDEGKPKMKVFYSRMLNSDGSTDDTTKMSPPELCKFWMS